MKLFASTYPALYVAYFSEPDTYCEVCGLSIAGVIEGVCLEPRIGLHCNSLPSVTAATACPRTSGSCWSTTAVPQSFIEAIVESNCTRKVLWSSRWSTT